MKIVLLNYHLQKRDKKFAQGRFVESMLLLYAIIRYIPTCYVDCKIFSFNILLHNNANIRNHNNQVF